MAALQSELLCGCPRGSGVVSASLGIREAAGAAGRSPDRARGEGDGAPRTQDPISTGSGDRELGEKQAVSLSECRSGPVQMLRGLGQAFRVTGAKKWPVMALPPLWRSERKG